MSVVELKGEQRHANDDDDLPSERSIVNAAIELLGCTIPAARPIWIVLQGQVFTSSIVVCSECVFTKYPPALDTNMVSSIPMLLTTYVVTFDLHVVLAFVLKATIAVVAASRKSAGRLDSPNPINPAANTVAALATFDDLLRLKWAGNDVGSASKQHD